MRLQVRMQKILAAAMLAGETGMAESMVGIIMPGSSRLDQVADIIQSFTFTANEACEGYHLHSDFFTLKDSGGQDRGPGFVFPPSRPPKISTR